jgi:threonine dehydrogenase-like Zn-dependent dehydrogenase
MLSFDHQSYIPFAMEYVVVPYYNELVKLQEQRLGEKEYCLVKPLTDENLLKNKAY